MHRSTRSKTLSLIPPLVSSRFPRPRPFNHQGSGSIEGEVEFDSIRENLSVGVVELNSEATPLTVNPTSTNFDDSRDLSGVENLNSPDSSFPSTMDIGGISTNNQGPPPLAPLNPLVQPRGLSIVVPSGLQAAPMPPNLPCFNGTRDEDPSTHVKRFIELLTTCLITDHWYFLVWFPTTLRESAYEWYRNHAASTFRSWDELMRAFLEKYRPEVGQSAALTALANFRQGKDEDIPSYIRRFEHVVTRFVGNLLTDDTLRHFFLQGFFQEKIVKEILQARPTTLEDAKRAARIVAKVALEHEKLWRRESESIRSFIPIPARDKSGLERAQPSTLNYSPQVANPIPLNVRIPEPLPTLTFELDWRQEMKREIQEAQKGFHDQLQQQLRTMTDQMVFLLRNQNSNAPPSQIESGRHASGLWCTSCGQNGHTMQFCTTFCQQPPHRNQSLNEGQDRRPPPQWDNCRTYGKRHPPQSCWVETRVVCGNCRKNHPTDRCRTRDKVIPMGPLVGNFSQQAMDNQRGAKNPSHDNNLHPPNMYYDYNNHRQNQQPPQGLQTKQGFVPLGQNPGQSSQDARFASNTSSSGLDTILENRSQGTSQDPSSSQSHYVSHEPLTLEKKVRFSLPAHAVLTRAQKGKQQFAEPEYESFSEDSPHLSELNEVVQKALETTREANKKTPSIDPTTLNSPSRDRKGSGQSCEPPTPEWEGPRIPLYDKGIKPSPSPSTFKPYEFLEDLDRLKADISIAQLLQLAPSLYKGLKKTSSKRVKVKANLAARVGTSRRPLEKMFEVRAVEIEATIVDKILPRVLVDGGSGVNIMPLRTMEQLGLEFTGPSHMVINMANQAREAPLGQIRGCKVSTGGEVYTLTFQVIRMHSNRNSFPLLLGRPWLRAANAKVDWSGSKPHIVFGPESNLTKIYIQPSHPTNLGYSSSSSEDEDHVNQDVQNGVKFASPEFQKKGNSDPLACLGPGLYE